MFHHLAHTVIEDDRELAGKGRIVGATVRDGGGDQVAGAVLVLQPLATQGGTPCGRAQQETSRPLVGSGPDQVTDTLETEHRVVDVERQHAQAVDRIAGGRRHPGADGAGLADPFFEYLAVGSFAIAENRTDVLRLVALPDAGVDADLSEQVGHAEGTGLVGDDGNDPRSQLPVLEQVAEHPHKGHRGGHLLALGPGGEPRIPVDGRDSHRRGFAVARRYAAAEQFAAMAQITHFRTVFSRFIEAQGFHLFIRQRQAETVAKGQQRFPIEFLLLVRGHLALPGLPHAEAFLGLGQDHRRPAFVQARRPVGGMDLEHVMAAALETVDLFIAHASNQPGQGFVLSKEVFAVIGAVLGGKGLELAIDGLRQRTHQQAVIVPRQQRVPVRAPDQLDHVPASSLEQRFQFIDDPPVAAHRTVQALQVAVDHPSQVVQPFPGRQGQGRHAFRLIHLAIAEDAPHMAVGGVLQAAMVQVAHEPRLENRADGTDAHRAGGELPEVRHQPGMRVTGQALDTGLARADLLAIVLQFALAQAPFEKGAGIDARCRVRLVEHQVAVEAIATGPEEMVEADLEQVRRTGITGDMSAQFAIGAIGADHHGQGIPAGNRCQAFLGGEVAGKARLLLDRNAVHVGTVGGRLPGDCRGPRDLGQHVEHLPGSLRAAVGQQRLQGVTPLLQFIAVCRGLCNGIDRVKTVHWRLLFFLLVYAGPGNFFDRYEAKTACFAA